VIPVSLWLYPWVAFFYRRVYIGKTLAGRRAYGKP
jgi:hypothetical protein